MFTYTTKSHFFFFYNDTSPPKISLLYLHAFFFFFFKDPAPPDISPFPLHPPLPIPAGSDPPQHRPVWSERLVQRRGPGELLVIEQHIEIAGGEHRRPLRGGIVQLAHRLGDRPPDRKSTRLNSSHSQISYAVFCLKKK